jgi:hypothetical protein
MAASVQVNLARLRDEDARRCGLAKGHHDIKVIAPGEEVDVFHEALIDEAQIRQCTAEQVHGLLHEMWGRFCMMCWLFSVEEPPETMNLAGLPAENEVRCDAVLEIKHAEIHARFWRLLWEQRRRHDVNYIASAQFAEDQALARNIPDEVFGRPADQVTDSALILACCEYAGMIGALRWVMDRQLSWNEPGIMNAAERPF